MGLPKVKLAQSVPDSANTPLLNAGKELLDFIHKKSNSLNPPKQLNLLFHELLSHVKLIIWDMDETFWEGTLREGTLKYLDSNHNLIIKLAKSGIVNSICSHNKHSEVLAVLKEHKIDEFFIFPQISQEPKGPAVAKIIENCQLREANTLFLDDNIRIRNEVKHFNPGILTLDPKDFLIINPEILSLKDQGLVKLKEYKHLEKKATLKQSLQISNEDFLRESHVRLELIVPQDDMADRTYELLTKTNQLNFTKKRSSKEEILADFHNSELECRIIRVKDKYGDYGICGFYSLNTKTKKLDHFVFSCRILNMGIEQFLYKLLHMPELSITGEVFSDLHKPKDVDWISLEVSSDITEKPPSLVPKRKKINILLKGSCDLGAIQYTLSADSTYNITAELHEINSKGYACYWPEHSQMLRLSQNELLRKSHATILNKIPWLDDSTFLTHWTSKNNQVVVYSILQDFKSGLYRYQDSNLILPAENFELDITDNSNWPKMFTELRERSKLLGIDRPFLEWFSRNFSFLGPMTPDMFEKNIRYLRSMLPEDTLLILLNCSEVPLPHKSRQVAQHIKINKRLDLILDTLPMTKLLDVRKYATSSSAHAGNLNHYQRRIYVDLSDEISTIIARQMNIKNRTSIKKILYKLMFKLDINRRLRRLRGILARTLKV